jgi:hypothetical protein
MRTPSAMLSSVNLVTDIPRNENHDPSHIIDRAIGLNSRAPASGPGGLVGARPLYERVRDDAALKWLT